MLGGSLSCTCMAAPMWTFAPHLLQTPSLCAAWACAWGRIARSVLSGIGVPSLEIQAACQRYTRTGDTTYLHENLNSGYSNEITVGEQGLVTLYPGAFERLA